MLLWERVLYIFVLLKKKKEYKGIWGPYDGAVIDKLWLLEGGQISAASVLDWYQNNFYQGDSYETIIRQAEEIPIGCDGLVALDFFQEIVLHIKRQEQKVFIMD